MDFQNATEKKLQNSTIFQMVKNPKSMTLFVIDIYFDGFTDTKKLVNVIDLIQSACYSVAHPKCLLLIHSKQQNLRFEEFLKRMWIKRFLDATILQILQQVHDENLFIFK